MQSHHNDHDGFDDDNKRAATWVKGSPGLAPARDSDNDYDELAESPAGASLVPAVLRSDSEDYTDYSPGTGGSAGNTPHPARSDSDYDELAESPAGVPLVSAVLRSDSEELLEPLSLENPDIMDQEVTIRTPSIILYETPSPNSVDDRGPDSGSHSNSVKLVEQPELHESHPPDGLPSQHEVGALPPADAYTVHGNSMDSGYVSALASGCQKDALIRQDDIPETTEPTDVEACEVATLYSDEGSISGAELTAYKSELVDHLAEQVRKLGMVPETLETIFEDLPSLMKAFALKLGQPGSTKAERDVMYFVHKHRYDLTQRLKETMLELAEEDSEPQPEPERVDRNLTTARINEWLATVGAPGAGEPIMPAHKPHLTTTSEEGEAEEVVLPDKPGYRRVVFDSEAYKQLVARIARASFLTSLTDSDAMMRIRSAILQSLPSERYVSRHRESKVFTMMMRMVWDPAAFLRQGYQDVEKPDELLGRVITLTGSLSNAQALSTSEYLKQTWPGTGSTLLAAIVEALRTSEVATRTLLDRSQIQVMRNGDSHQFHLQAKGTAEFIAEVGEIVAWLAAALRLSKDDDLINCCTPRVVFSGKPSVFDERAFHDMYDCEIGFDLSPDLDNKGRSGQCWLGMFRNPVVVRGFPILRRSRRNTGLEIPLDMAAGLVDAKRLHEFAGQLCLKGFSAMLTAVEAVGGVILWHLVYDATGGRVSYLDTVQGHKAECPDVNALRSSRHMIGWCSEALYLAGDYATNLDIRRSMLPIPGKEFTLEKVSFSVGQIVTGGCQFSIGRKDIPLHISKQGYIAKLQWIDQRYVVLWDEGDKRGWLVNGTSALLHVLRSSLKHCGDDKFSDEFLFDAREFQEPKVRFRNDSAVSVLRNPSNRRLRLYKLSEDSVDETVLWADGRRETVTKVRTSYTTVEDKTLELFETLEKLIDHEAQSEASAKGVNMKPRVRCLLQGWDFCDVVRNRDPLYLRVATVPSSGGHWVDFAKSIRAVTLFGRGFGDLIKPVFAKGGSWPAVPTGTGSLGACMADLRDIIDNEGDRTTQPLTLSRGILWHNPSQNSPFEAHSPDVAGENPIQELFQANSPFRALLLGTKSSTGIDIDDCQHGAVIFGRSELSRLWPDAKHTVAGAVGARGSLESLPADSMQGVEKTLDSGSSCSRSPLDPPSLLLGSSAESGTQPTTARPHTPPPTRIEADTRKRDALQMEGDDQQNKLPEISKRLKVVSLMSALSRGGRRDSGASQQGS